MAIVGKLTVGEGELLVLKVRVKSFDQVVVWSPAFGQLRLPAAEILRAEVEEDPGGRQAPLKDRVLRRVVLLVGADTAAAVHLATTVGRLYVRQVRTVRSEERRVGKECRLA